jgi:ubiquinone/menaquinone biosynthesis C-methylase UbiE
MRYNPIEEEIKWRVRKVKEDKKSKTFPPRDQFVYAVLHSRLYDTLVTLGCDSCSSILEVGCGSGAAAIYLQKATKNIVGVDISSAVLKRFTTNSFQGILADVKKLPFRSSSSSFDYVISSGLLHHLIGQGDLKEYLREFARVTAGGGM